MPVTTAIDVYCSYNIPCDLGFETQRQNVYAYSFR